MRCESSPNPIRRLLVVGTPNAILEMLVAIRRGLYPFAGEELNGNRNGLFRWFTQPDIKLSAIVEHLSQFDIDFVIASCIRLNLGQQFEWRAKGDVQRRLPLAGHELSCKRSSDGVLSVYRAEASYLLQYLFRNRVIRNGRQRAPARYR